MEYRVTLKKSGVISVYLDKKALLEYIKSLVNDGIAFTFEEEPR